MAYLTTPGEFEKTIDRNVLHFRSKRLDAVVDAINLFVKSPKRSRLTDITTKLDQWKQMDPKEFANRGKATEVALRKEIADKQSTWGEGEIGIVDAGCHPRYEPGRWNDRSKIQESTNCYAYACNDPMGHARYDKPQPGQLGGRSVTQAEESVVRWAVMRDDLTRNRAQLSRLVPLVRLRGEAVPDHVVNVPGYYLIALITAPDADYHWVRQDDNGMWSHKPGHGSVTDLDFYGKPIFDPRDATFAVPVAEDQFGNLMYKPYDFTTFYYAPKGGVRTGDLGSVKGK
jgi:hypothetical protein